jgi:hypothetical protein
MSPDELSALPPLTREDHEMIGIFIQHYNFIDLNLRRALEIFAMAKLLPAHARKKYPDIVEAQLANIAKEAIETMDPTVEDIPTASQKLVEISYGRLFRNLIGHFAAKRFPGEEVFVFVSKSDRDAKRVLGRGLRAHHVHTAVVGRTELRALTLHLTGHSNWLAHRIPIWDKRYLCR